MNFFVDKQLEKFTSVKQRNWLWRTKTTMTEQAAAAAAMPHFTSNFADKST